MEIELIELVESSPELPRSVVLSTGLILLGAFLAGVYFRHASVLGPTRQTLTYRLALASIAGWLSAWFLLPFSFLPIPETRGFFVPGALFGLLVMVPMLEDPVRHWFRATILVWAAAVAYAAMWLAAMVNIEVVEAYWPKLLDGTYWSPMFSEEAINVLILGGPAGIVFGIIASVPMSRVLVLRLKRAHWLLIIILSGACGTIYAGAVTDSWPEWIDSLERYTFADSFIFLAHILWYVLLGAVFSLGKSRPLAPTGHVDHALLGSLALLTILVVWSMGFENYPYEWFR